MLYHFFAHESSIQWKNRRHSSKCKNIIFHSKTNGNGLAKQMHANPSLFIFINADLTEYGFSCAIFIPELNEFS